MFRLLVTAVVTLLPVHAQLPGLVEIRAARTGAPTVFVIGGLDGVTEHSAVVAREVDRYRRESARSRRFHLLAIPNANPKGFRLQFPPAGKAYREHPESHAIWRSIGLQAPDLVVVVGEDRYGLARALSTAPVAAVGSMPAVRVDAQPGLLHRLPAISTSEARREMNRRLARTPIEVARELEPFYGHELPEPVYIPGMALIARIRLGQLRHAVHIGEPYASGAREALEKPTASHLSGHLFFAELAQRTGDKRYVSLVRRAADLGFAADGAMKDAMPMHNEMSDAVFMSCPLLTKAGKLTGESRYFDMAIRHFRFMERLCRRSDDLYRHSPLHAAAWGRGNAFPALGLALSLEDMPKHHPGFEPMLSAYRALMKRLAGFQDTSGMWHQVIDEPTSYAEFSATAMIGRAMLIGVRNGWLNRTGYEPRIRAAWRAVSSRVARDGTVGEVCKSTGKQTSLQAYLDREAILGRDPRGGGMGMMFAVEMAGVR